MQTEPPADLSAHLPPGAREFLPEREDASSWARLHAYRLTMHHDLHPEDPAEPDDVAASGMRHPDPYSEDRHFVLERRGRVVSALLVSGVRPGTPDYDQNRHRVSMDIGVLPELRRQGIAHAWLPLVVAFAESRGARLVGADTDHDSGHRFLEAIGAEARFRGWENRLWLDRVDWRRMAEWTRIDAAGNRLERYEPFPPEEIWERYAAGYTELSNHVPREGLEIGDWVLTPERMRSHRDLLREQGRTLHVLAAWDGAGMAGITELLHSAHEPGVLQQELTAIHPRARGRGLAKLLKAALLIELRERYPDVRYVRTENAESNAAMWRINEEMGFVHHRLGVGYELPVDRLRVGAG